MEPTSYSYIPPQEVIADIVSIPVRFVDFEGQEQQGKIEVHKYIEHDIRDLFEYLYELQFPLSSVIPFSKCNESDDESMSTNNSYAFGYRTITGKPTELSIHAFGCAIDLNPRQNPYVNNGEVLPPDGRYDPRAPGTFTQEHPVVMYMKERGFEWGGDWGKGYDDFHHFQKALPEALMEKYKNIFSQHQQRGVQ